MRSSVLRLPMAMIWMAGVGLPVAAPVEPAPICDSRRGENGRDAAEQIAGFTIDECTDQRAILRIPLEQKLPRRNAWMLAALNNFPTCGNSTPMRGSASK